MPGDVTAFAAQDLVLIDALLAVVAVVYLLYRRPRAFILRWVIAVVVVVIVGFVAAKIGAAVYTDPRPFTTDHIRPLVSHAPDNGFPSDHALLAAAIVAAVALVSPLWSLPFVLLGFLVDWARVGAGIHHVADVVGSALFVALGLLIAVFVAPLIVSWLSRRISGRLRGGAASGAQRPR
ncbi:MAG: phosphatase PAP2 family protein [Chloroflexota bacterium]